MKLTKEQKEILKGHMEVIKEAKELEDELYKQYRDQGKRSDELQKEMIKSLVDFKITDLYQLSYNYMEKLEEMVK